MRRFSRNESGLGAIEFAMIGPFMAIMLLGIQSSWSYMRQSGVMRDTVEAVSKYYVQGGTNDTQAASIGSTAWTNKPDGGTLVITRTKTCGTATVTTSNCSDGSIPNEALVVLASASWTDPTSIMIFPNGLTINQSETIRVR